LFFKNSKGVGTGFHSILSVADDITRFFGSYSEETHVDISYEIG